MRRHPPSSYLRLGSNNPKRLPNARIAGASVRAAATITRMTSAHGTPIDRKSGSRVRLRHRVAPTIVRPDPRITCETPEYAV
ncbi:Uncharacterised protein [Mycobacteroides abscessus subsp. abscessus]|nr:Uncharacterised protein [Mycobacteroides abscessus subsp. abscessus]